MKICYVDEAGCLGSLPSHDSPIQPLFVLAGVVIDSGSLKTVTHHFIHLKKRFYKTSMEVGTHLDMIMREVKGSNIRNDVRSGNRRMSRHSLMFLQELLALLKSMNVVVLGKMFIKGIGCPFNGTSVYTSAIQDICRHFQHYLASTNDTGLIVADSRRKAQNANVSHSVFTQKFGASDSLSNMLEMPLFGHSENHAGIQLADLLCSAILFPMGTYSFCSGIVTSVHVDSNFREIKRMAGGSVEALQYCYSQNSSRRGGIVVSNPNVATRGN